MRRVFQTSTFTRWMRKAGLTDDALCDAVSEMVQGLVDADLGGHVVKKRIALPGQGKRGGARTIVATKMAGRWFFLYGFGKNERANIDKDELKVFQEVISLCEGEMMTSLRVMWLVVWIGSKQMCFQRLMRISLIRDIPFYTSTEIRLSKKCKMKL